MRSEVIGAGRLRNERSVSFNGVDEVAYVDDPPFATDTQGAFSMWVYVNSLLGSNGLKTVCGLAGDGPASPSGLFWIMQRRNNNIGSDNHFEMLHRRVGSSQYNQAIATTTPLTVGWHHLLVQSDGSTWTIRINNTLQSLASFISGATNNGDWLGDANPDGTQKLSLASIYSTGAASFSNYGDFRINQAYYRSTPFTTAEAAIAAANPLRNLRTRIPGLVACWPLAAPDDATGTLQEQVDGLDLTTMNMDAATNYVASVP